MGGGERLHSDRLVQNPPLLSAAALRCVLSDGFLLRLGRPSGWASHKARSLALLLEANALVAPLLWADRILMLIRPAERGAPLLLVAPSSHCRRDPVKHKQAV